MQTSVEVLTQALKIIDKDADPVRFALASGLLALSLEIETMRKAQKTNTENLAKIESAVSQLQSKTG